MLDKHCWLDIPAQIMIRAHMGFGRGKDERWWIFKMIVNICLPWRSWAGLMCKRSRILFIDLPADEEELHLVLFQCFSHLIDADADMLPSKLMDRCLWHHIMGHLFHEYIAPRVLCYGMDSRKNQSLTPSLAEKTFILGLGILCLFPFLDDFGCALPLPSSSTSIVDEDGACVGDDPSNGTTSFWYL